MNKARAIIIACIAILAVAALLTGIGIYAANRLLHLDNYKAEIIDEVQKALNRRVTYAAGELTFRFGLAFSFSKVVIKEKDGTTDFLTADRIYFRLSLLHLLEKKVVLTEVTLKKPYISFIRESSGKFNFSDLLEEKKDESVSLQVDEIWFSGGDIRFTDFAASTNGLSVELKDTDFSIDHFKPGKKTKFKLSSTLLHTGGKTGLILGGTARLPAKGQPWAATELNAKVIAKGLNPGFFLPYYGKYVPFKPVEGLFNLNTEFKGKITDFKSHGDVDITGLRFDYPQVFHGIIAPKSVHFTYSLDRTPTAVKVKSINLKVDALKVKGSCSILDINTKDPRIVAQAVTSQFHLQDFRVYIPYGIIVKGPADFIESHVIGGDYQLDEGRLDGRISQILHMERDENYNILYIKGRVTNGLMTFGPAVPAFNSIKGNLEMKGKDFILHGMSAKFGESPFTLEGKIADYPLESSSGYPFTMSMKPRQSEVAWLMGQPWGKKLTFSGDTAFRLSGSGPSDNFNLSGDWDLTNASYSYPDFVRKPGGRQNSMKFQGRITKQEMKLTSLNYSLAPLNLSLSADYQYAGEKGLELSLQTNRFASQDVAAMIPQAARFQTTGVIQANLHADSSTGGISDLEWKGTVSLAGFSFKPSERIKTVSSINGTINFNGSTLETSHLSARLANSIIQGKGTLTGFKNPSLQLTFNSPMIDPVDFGLIAPKPGTRITGLSGSVILKDNSLQIASLSGKVNNSVLSLKGVVKDLKNPNIDIALNSSRLEVEDVIFLAGIRDNNPSTAPVQSLSLKATVSADTGKVKDIPFERLKGVVVYDNNILYLQQTEASLCGGSLSGSARIDLGTSGPSRRFQTSYKMQNVSAEQLLKALGVTSREIKGTVSLQGELTAKGETAADIKQTLLGSAKLRIEDGSVRRFPTLSKVFSILNLSQLLKFQLPDMVSGGMPFNEITGTFAITDGIISTTDLYIDSDAINISAVGSVNLARNQIDAVIGVKPLQTIDKIVSRIPIVGWVLTGKNRALFTTYFEAKGNVDNPVVIAIPVKAMTKGVFNVFRRLFELPARLVTDTGEVILGN